MKMRSFSIALTLVLLSISVSAGEVVTVEVSNMHPGLFSFTPPWVAFHDGTFDAFDAGSPASMGIETIAELGDFSVLAGEFAGSAASGVDGAVLSDDPPPPFLPGEGGALMLDIGDASVHRYFSFASMLLPSNDAFIGNDDPMAYEIFDAGGSFLGPVTIDVYASDVWDAGTEVNDISSGPAFVVGADATAGTDEDGMVMHLFSTPGVDDYLASMVGVETPIGTIMDPLMAGDLLATITIVPEPACLALLGVALIAIRRR